MARCQSVNPSEVVHPGIRHNLAGFRIGPGWPDLTHPARRCDQQPLKAAYPVAVHAVQRYNLLMRVLALFALWLPAFLPASLPSGWKLLKDSKGACQISIPEDWEISSDQAGFAVLHDASTAIAVVTSQPGQAFKPLSDTVVKLMGLRKEKIFENSATRVFYQDKIPASSSDTKALSAMVPGKTGTCSARVVYLAEVPEETARKIVLSVGPASE